MHVVRQQRLMLPASDIRYNRGGSLYDFTRWHSVCDRKAMLRRSLLLLASLAAIGCQTKAPAPVPQALQAEPYVEAVTASALVFDPPVAQDEPRLELSRADRQARVAVGYEPQTVEYFYIRLDDRQISNGIGTRFGRGGGGSFDRYERRAVTERVGVRYR